MNNNGFSSRPSGAFSNSTNAFGTGDTIGSSPGYNPNGGSNVAHRHTQQTIHAGNINPAVSGGMSNGVVTVGSDDVTRFVAPAVTSHCDNTNELFLTGLGPYDVLLGRGAPAVNHEGNIRFRRIAQGLKDDYIATRRRGEKEAIARRLIAAVRANNGRFLRRIESPVEAEELGVPIGVSAWTDVDEPMALEKAKQALRDREVWDVHRNPLPIPSPPTDGRTGAPSAEQARKLVEQERQRKYIAQKQKREEEIIMIQRDQEQQAKARERQQQAQQQIREMEQRARLGTKGAAAHRRSTKAAAARLTNSALEGSRPRVSSNLKVAGSHQLLPHSHQHPYPHPQLASSTPIESQQRLLHHAPLPPLANQQHTPNLTAQQQHLFLQQSCLKPMGVTRSREMTGMQYHPSAFLGGGDDHHAQSLKIALSSQQRSGKVGATHNQRVEENMHMCQGVLHQKQEHHLASSLSPPHREQLYQGNSPDSVALGKEGKEVGKEETEAEGMSGVANTSFHREALPPIHEDPFKRTERTALLVAETASREQETPTPHTKSAQEESETLNLKSQLTAIRSRREDERKVSAAEASLREVEARKAELRALEEKRDKMLKERDALQKREAERKKNIKKTTLVPTEFSDLTTAHEAIALGCVEFQSGEKGPISSSAAVLSLLEVHILRTLSAHGLPIWTNWGAGIILRTKKERSEPDATGFVPGAKAFQGLSWEKFGEVLLEDTRHQVHKIFFHRQPRKTTRTALSQMQIYAHEKAVEVAVAFLEEPRELAILVLSLLEKVRVLAGYSSKIDEERSKETQTQQTNTKKDLNPCLLSDTTLTSNSISRWLDTQGVQWGATLGTLPVGSARPLPYSIHNFTESFPELQSHPFLEGVACLTKSQALSIYQQVAYISRLRSVCMVAVPTSSTTPVESQGVHARTVAVRILIKEAISLSQKGALQKHQRDMYRVVEDILEHGYDAILGCQTESESDAKARENALLLSNHPVSGPTYHTLGYTAAAIQEFLEPVIASLHMHQAEYSFFEIKKTLQILVRSLLFEKSLPQNTSKHHEQTVTLHTKNISTTRGSIKANARPTMEYNQQGTGHLGAPSGTVVSYTDHNENSAVEKLAKCGFRNLPEAIDLTEDAENDEDNAADIKKASNCYVDAIIADNNDDKSTARPSKRKGSRDVVGIRNASAKNIGVGGMLETRQDIVETVATVKVLENRVTDVEKDKFRTIEGIQKEWLKNHGKIAGGIKDFAHGNTMEGGGGVGHLGTSTTHTCHAPQKDCPNEEKVIGVPGSSVEANDSIKVLDKEKAIIIENLGIARTDGNTEPTTPGTVTADELSAVKVGLILSNNEKKRTFEEDKVAVDVGVGDSANKKRPKLTT